MLDPKNNHITLDDVQEALAVFAAVCKKNESQLELIGYYEPELGYAYRFKKEGGLAGEIQLSIMATGGYNTD